VTVIRITCARRKLSARAGRLARVQCPIGDMSDGRIGRIQRQTRRALITAWPEPASVAHLLEWSYSKIDRPKRWHRKSMYRALKRWGVNVGYGKWAANTALEAQIRGE